MINHSAGAKAKGLVYPQKLALFGLPLATQKAHITLGMRNPLPVQAVGADPTRLETRWMLFAKGFQEDLDWTVAFSRNQRTTRQ